jgi:hypothetical protein
MVTGSRTLCVAVIVLLVLLYFGSYRFLLVDESENLSDIDLSAADGPLIIPPFPRPAYGEKYKIDGEGVRLFYWPANRLHRVLDKILPD